MIRVTGSPIGLDSRRCKFPRKLRFQDPFSERSSAWRKSPVSLILFPLHALFHDAANHFRQVLLIVQRHLRASISSSFGILPGHMLMTSWLRHRTISLERWHFRKSSSTVFWLTICPEQSS